MFKSSFLIARINSSLTIKFNSIIQSDDVSPSVYRHYKRSKNAEEVFSYAGSYYHKITPTTYLTLDFQEGHPSKDESKFNPLRSINLNRMQLFLFNKELEKVIKDFYKVQTSDNPLFWYDRDTLHIDNSVAERLQVNVSYMNRSIHTMFAIAEQDTPTGPIRYAGCMLYGGNISEYCVMTIEELEYFYDIISHIDYTYLALHVTQMGIEKKKEILNDSDVEESRPIEIHRVTFEKKEELHPDEQREYIPTQKDDSTEHIPDI